MRVRVGVLDPPAGLHQRLRSVPHTPTRTGLHHHCAFALTHAHTHTRMRAPQESINLWWINEALGSLGLSPLPTTPSNPISEAVFNFVIAWAALFLPAILTDGPSQKVERKVRPCCAVRCVAHARPQLARVLPAQCAVCGTASWRASLALLHECFALALLPLFAGPVVCGHRVLDQRVLHPLHGAARPARAAGASSSTSSSSGRGWQQQQQQQQCRGAAATQGGCARKPAVAGVGACSRRVWRWHG